MFILNRYLVSVDSFRSVEIYAKSRAQASYRAFEGYIAALDDGSSFKDFLKKKPLICKTDMPDNYGKKIIHKSVISGDEEVYYMGRIGNSVKFCRDNSDYIYHSHELDIRFSDDFSGN